MTALILFVVITSILTVAIMVIIIRNRNLSDLIIDFRLGAQHDKRFIEKIQTERNKALKDLSELIIINEGLKIKTNNLKIKFEKEKLK